MTVEQKEEHNSEIIGSLDLWVDNSRFDQTEMIVVGDKQFIRKDKVMSMLQKWDEHNKPARAEELKSHAVEFGQWLADTNWGHEVTKRDPPIIPTMNELYNKFNSPKP